MATFNTAFGALPSVKTLSAQQPKLAVTGKRRTPGEEDGDYSGNQQMQAQLQAQLGKTQQGGTGAAPTFADMQKQGRARPAPPPMQPAGLPGATPFLQDLNEALQFTPQRPVLLGGMEGMTPGLPQTPTGKTPYTPQFPGNQPQAPQAPQTPQAPPQAPQAPQVPAGPPPAPQAPQAPQAPTGASPVNVPSPVLRPEDEVRRITPSQPLPPPPVAPAAPAPAPTGAAPVAGTPPVLRAETPPLDEGGDKVTGSPTQTPVDTLGRPPAPPPYPTFGPYVPQPVTVPTIAPMDINALMNQLQTTLTPQQIAEQRAASGQAVTGPVVAPNTRFLDMLTEQLSALAAGPASQEQQAFEAQRKARQADLEAQFGAQRSQLEDELAARGLYASSIGAGRFGDLAGQQSRAIASMEAEVLNRQAELAAERQRTLISGLQGAAGVQADIDFRAAEIQQQERLRGREMDINEAQMLAQQEFQRGQLRQGYAEIQSRENIARAEVNLRAAEIQQQERLRGREMDIEQARNQAANELGYAEIRSREDVARAGRELDREVATLDRQLRETLGKQTYDLQRDEFLINLIRTLGADLPPDVLEEIIKKYNLRMPGKDEGGGNEDMNNPDTWKPGSIDGEIRKTADGREFRYNATQKKWLPVPPAGGGGGGGGSGGGGGGGGGTQF